MSHDNSYEQAVAWFLKHEELGYYNYYSDDESTWDKEVGCKENNLCLDLIPRGAATSVGSMMYYSQVWTEQRF